MYLLTTTDVRPFASLSLCYFLTDFRVNSRSSDEPDDWSVPFHPKCGYGAISGHPSRCRSDKARFDYAIEELFSQQSKRSRQCPYAGFTGISGCAHGKYRGPTDLHVHVVNWSGYP